MVNDFLMRVENRKSRKLTVRITPKQHNHLKMLRENNPEKNSQLIQNIREVIKRQLEEVSS